MNDSPHAPVKTIVRNSQGAERAGVRDAVLATLHRIAPEIEPREIDPALPLRDQIDLGSMDWFNLLAALEDAFGVAIPEADGATLATLDELLAYLHARLDSMPR